MKAWMKCEKCLWCTLHATEKWHLVLVSSFISSGKHIDNLFHLHKQTGLMCRSLKSFHDRSEEFTAILLNLSLYAWCLKLKVGGLIKILIIMLRWQNKSRLVIFTGNSTEKWLPRHILLFFSHYSIRIIINLLQYKWTHLILRSIICHTAKP